MRDTQGRERNFFGCLAKILAALVVVVLVALVAVGTVDIPFLTSQLADVEPEAPLIGIISGHWQYDSGAVCPDGLQEVDVNLAIARKVAVILRDMGYRVDLLPEYAPELNGYEADVFLSIHSDSCIGLTGFKVARRTDSNSPYLDDQLVQALYDTYSSATGLEPHYNTITEHMLEYHALRRVAPNTPGAIIECGFMGGNRRILTEGNDRVAEGIAQGLVTFLVAQGKAVPTPTVVSQ